MSVCYNKARKTYFICYDSKHLRHGSVKETLDTYSHIFPNETMGVIDKVFD